MQNSDFTLKDCLFGGVKLAKNADPDKYLYSGYSIGIDLRLEISLPDGSVGKNVIICGVDMSSSVHIDNKKKDISILGKNPTQRLDDTTLKAEAEDSINFLRSNRKFCISLYYNGNNSFLFANATKIYHFKANYSEIKNYPFCLGNISGDFSANNMKRIYNYMASVSKNVYIDKLDDIINKYNNTYHSTTKMKHIDVKLNTYIDLSNT